MIPCLSWDKSIVKQADKCEGETLENESSHLIYLLIDYEENCLVQNESSHLIYFLNDC